MESPAEHPTTTATVSATTTATASAPRWLVWLAGVVLVAAIVTAAWFMTGPAPRSATVAGSAASKRFPPLVLADDVDAASPLARAADLLEPATAAKAARAFTKLAVAQPEAVEPQVGLIVSRWRSTGPDAVIGDLAQVAKEHPDDGWVRLELGLARLLNDEPAKGQADLVAAQQLAQADQRYDVARHVDDLLHPALVPGYPPTVVGAADIRNASAAALVTQITNRLTLGDRVGAQRVARSGAATRAAEADPLVAAIVAAARFTKDRPLEADALLAAAAKRAPHNDAVMFQRALVLIWAGDDTRGRKLLFQVADHGEPNSRWRHDASLIAARLR